MQQDDLVKKVTSKLNGLAQHHPHQPDVMNHVIEHIQHKKSSHTHLWKMSGFAVAAAIAGLVILPAAFELQPQPQHQTVVSPKLSPQMMEDLEMLMLLGEDIAPHGS